MFNTKPKQSIPLVTFSNRQNIGAVSYNSVYTGSASELGDF